MPCYQVFKPIFRRLSGNQSHTVSLMQQVDQRGALMNIKKLDALSDEEIASRMDKAIRRSLHMPPKPHKESRKPRQPKAKKAAAKPGTASE